MGTPTLSELNVSNPDFFKQVNGVLETESLDALKTYVTWHLLNGAAHGSRKPFVDANFKMAAGAHRASGNSGRAGSAAWMPPTELWAKLWARAMSN